MCEPAIGSYRAYKDVREEVGGKGIEQDFYFEFRTIFKIAFTFVAQILSDYFHFVGLYILYSADVAISLNFRNLL